MTVFIFVVISKTKKKKNYGIKKVAKVEGLFVPISSFFQ